MGPRSRERGNKNVNAKRIDQLIASMGPRSRERGNFVSKLRREFVGIASMGPRSRERGNASRYAHSLAHLPRFNGAALT